MNRKIIGGTMVMGDIAHDETLHEIRRRIMRAAGKRVVHIILFGSRSTGFARADSDYDLLVVEKDPVDKRAEARRLRRELRDTAFPADVHVIGETEFEETRAVIGGIAYPAVHQGIFVK